VRHQRGRRSDGNAVHGQRGGGDLWGTKRGERWRQRGDDDGARQHSSPGVARRGRSGGVRCSDSGGGWQPRQRTAVSSGWQWGGTEVRARWRGQQRCAQTAGVARLDTGPVETGLYPRPRRRAAPPCSANRSKALHDTDDDKWAMRVSNFLISINSEINHSRRKNSQARRKI
jgi:hypothetical protein